MNKGSHSVVLRNLEGFHAALRYLDVDAGKVQAGVGGSA